MTKKDFDIDYILDVNYREDPLRFILDTSFWTIIVTVIIFFAIKITNLFIGFLVKKNNMEITIIHLFINIIILVILFTILREELKSYIKNPSLLTMIFFLSGPLAIMYSKYLNEKIKEY
jgi:undecaprenyl pyrophosphate phosphatase UppP